VQSQSNWTDAPKDRAGEDAQGPLGSARATPRSQGHPGDRHRVVPCSRSRVAPEAIASSLRDDSRPSPLDGDDYCADLLVTD
jgi:hypothetical protein